MISIFARNDIQQWASFSVKEVMLRHLQKIMMWQKAKEKLMLLCLCPSVMTCSIWEYA